MNPSYIVGDGPAGTDGGDRKGVLGDGTCGLAVMESVFVGGCFDFLAACENGERAHRHPEYILQPSLVSFMSSQCILIVRV